ncbi:ComF family protein [Anaerolinea thermophila]|nr:ComF family protein [Anaerolinea thermophila]
MNLSGSRMRPASFLYHLGWTAVDWLFPPYCLDCGTLGERWCETCQQKISLLAPPLCERCGRPVELAGLCVECQHAPISMDAIRSCYAYEGIIREAIHRLKFEKDLGLAEILANALIKVLSMQDWNIDVITSVPVSPARMKERGYNQAEMLAFPLALNTGVPYKRSLLKRVKDAPSQVGLSKEERRENIREAFEGLPQASQYSSVLVVDDVVTTGSTLQSCALALREQGVKQVYGLTLARAISRDPLARATS